MCINNIALYVNRQVNEISHGGFPVLFRKLEKFLLSNGLVILSIGLLPIVFLIRVISPLFLIRWFKFHNLKIGHHAGDTELHLCEQKNKIKVPGDKKYFNIYFNQFRNSANKELEKLWMRQLFVIPFG